MDLSITLSEEKRKTGLSKMHIIPGSLIFGLLFTYAGVEVPLWEVFFHVDFLIWFNINIVIVFGLWNLVYFLQFKKDLNLIFNIFLSILALVLWEFSASILFEYEPEDFTELFSITLPFGSALLVAFNIFYHLLKKLYHTQNNSETLNISTPTSSNSNDQENIWVNTLMGKTKIQEKEIRYVQLTEVGIAIKTNKDIIIGFNSLKSFEDLLVNQSQFFRLNKQYLSSKLGIISFKSLSDGRIQIRLIDDEKCLVSKNKAAAFRQWFK